MRRLAAVLIPAALLIGASATPASAGWDLGLGCDFADGVSTCRTSSGPTVIGSEPVGGPAGCTTTLTRTREVVTTVVKRGQAHARGEVLSEFQETFDDARFERTCDPEGHIFLTDGTQPGHWTPLFYASGFRPGASLQVTVEAVHTDGRTWLIGRGEAAQYDYANSDGYFGFGQQVSCDIVRSLIFTASDGTTTRTTTADSADAPTCSS